MVRQGEIYKLDLRKALVDAGAWAIPQWQKTVRLLYRRSDGYVMVEKVRGDVADVYDAVNPAGRMLGSIRVPVSALRAASTRSGAVTKEEAARELVAMAREIVGASPKEALLGLYLWATTGDRTGNPYSKTEVREAIKALGDSSGFDIPNKRPSGKVLGALYDLAVWATTGNRAGNPHAVNEVKAANRALGGDGFDLPKGLTSSKVAAGSKMEHGMLRRA